MIPIVELIRLEESIEKGTIGVLRVQKEVFCFTLEPPDKLNLRNVSNIPAQQYLCEKYNSHRFGPTYQVCNVPGRSAILFHGGNVKEHTEGCILLGRAIGSVGSRKGLIFSQQAFEGFIEKLEGAPTFHLTIREAY